LPDTGSQQCLLTPLVGLPKYICNKHQTQMKPLHRCTGYKYNIIMQIMEGSSRIYGKRIPSSWGKHCHMPAWEPIIRMASSRKGSVTYRILLGHHLYMQFEDGRMQLLRIYGHTRYEKQLPPSTTHCHQSPPWHQLPNFKMIRELLTSKTNIHLVVQPMFATAKCKGA
jgi:hypothetical protein